MDSLKTLIKTPNSFSCSSHIRSHLEGSWTTNSKESVNTQLWPNYEPAKSLSSSYNHKDFSLPTVPSTQFHYQFYFHYYENNQPSKVARAMTLRGLDPSHMPSHIFTLQSTSTLSSSDTPQILSYLHGLFHLNSQFLSHFIKTYIHPTPESIYS